MSAPTPLHADHHGSYDEPRPQAAVIMAAGKGTRMRSQKSKVLHEVAGVPMIERVVRVALEAGLSKVVVVLGHQSEEVQAHLKARFEGVDLTWAIQAEQLGTAHAVQCAEQALKGFEGDVWILSGDVPTLERATFEALKASAQGARLVVAGMRLAEPKAYGRLLTDERGLYAIREARDCTPQELEVCEVNAGLYRVEASLLFEGLKSLKSDNAQGELYLTDLVQYTREQMERAGAQGWVACHVFEGEGALALEGVNDRLDLALAERRAQRRVAERLMREGVTLLDPARVALSEGVKGAPDCLLEPGVSLFGEVELAEGCVIEANARLTNVRLAPNARVGHGCVLHNVTLAEGVELAPYSHLEGAKVGARSSVGPFARLREGTELGEGCKVGNFVETKKAQLGDGAKASHLSYLGDVKVGARANVGAGTITCNYDGYSKHKTEIGEGAFIGSDTQLVAPVKVGAGAFVGAGSTITKDVSAGALALSRPEQSERAGWADRFHAKQRARR